MLRVLKYIVLINILLSSFAMKAQYIDTVCTNTLGRGYHVFGLPGSTYTWTIPGGTPAPVSTGDTVFVNWGSVPGVYTISVIEHSIDGCNGPLVVGPVKVVSNPTVFAGTNTTICSDSTATLSNSDSTFCSRILWTSSGDGNFSNSVALHPTYTPGPLDIFAGIATLTLTGYGLGLSCPNVTSTVLINIIKQVTANAGPDVSACASTPFAIVGSTAANFSTLAWTDNGTGVLINPTTLHPVYTPAIGEIGNVTFTLHAYSILPCHDSAVDQLIMTIFPVPTGKLSLLSKDTLCGGDTILLRIDLTGTPSWTLTLNDGIADTTLIIGSTPYFLTLFPPTSRTYTIKSLFDLHCPALPGTLTDTIRVTVHPKPGAQFTWNYGNQNNVIHFHIDSTVLDTTIIGYMVQWNFGDGTFGSGHDPVHTYPAPNTFHVTMTVTDTFGCSNSITHDVFIPSIPIAFYSSNSPVCNGTPMCFQDLSTVPSPPPGFVQTWIWNFGDGTPQDTIQFPGNPNVCHTYAGTGIYAVSLTIKDNLGATSNYVHNQQVIPDPIAAFTYSISCNGQPVQFTDASSPNGGGTIISWNWNFGDPTSGVNNTSNLQNPSHIFSTGNTVYNVTLVIQNLNGCGDTFVKMIHLLAGPTVAFTHDSACDDQVVHYAANPALMQIDSIVSWSWNFGDGSPFVTTPVTAIHAFTSPGVYITTLTVTDHHGCQNSVSNPVNVHPLPISGFSWSSPVCMGNPVNYLDNSTLPVGYTGYLAKWLWDFGDGTSQMVMLPSSPNVTHTFVGSAISHVVRLTVWTSDSCSQFIEHTVISIPSPIADFKNSAVDCMNQPVQFSDASQSNGGGSIIAWRWNFNDPVSGTANTSTLQYPVHTFINAGTYHVSLVVTSSSGCTDSINKTLNINNLPFANFRADTACLLNATHFTDLSTFPGSTIISYTWNFGDGSGLSHVQNPTHTYAVSGVFNVTLTIVNSNGCTKDTTNQVIVNSLPVAAFSYSSNTCMGSPVQYIDLSTLPTGYLGSIVKWVWDFGDGTSVTILAPANPNATHTFAGTATSHVVRLTVTTSNGCSGFIEHTINSVASPLADFTYPANNCLNQSVQFTDQTQTNGGSAIASWTWNFGDPLSGTNNTSNLKNPVHIFTNPGSYAVMLIVSNANTCSDTVVKTVIINALPIANFSADTVCLNSVTQFTDRSTPNGGSIISWTWDFGDGSTFSTLQNPTHIYTSFGVMNVKLTVVNSNGCSKDTIKQVVVRPLPIAAFTFSNENCHGSSVQFTDASTIVTGSTSPINQWVWNFGDGTPPLTITSPNNPNITHVFAGSGSSYIVRLTVTTIDGCSAFVDHTITVLAAPSADFTYQSGNCVSHSVQFTDNSQGNGNPITQWSWNFGDPGSGANNSSSMQNPSHTFSIAGTYTVTEIIFNASNCSDTATHTVTVLTSPIANFTADTACFGDSTSFTDLSTSSAGIITQHLWQFGDGTTSTATNPVHAYPAAGNYQVTLTVTTINGCAKDTIKTVIVLPKPVSAFTASAPTCLDNTVNFTDNSTTMNGTIHSWVWNFGDGTIVTIFSPASPNVSHLYLTSGIFNVLLTITTTTGCTSSVTNTVEIQPGPVAGFTYSATHCMMNPVQFTDHSQGNGSPITQWLWNFDDPASGGSNTSTIPDPLHSFTHAGNFNVVLTVTNASGCVNAVTQIVNISVRPVAQFSFDTACAGSPTQFIDHSVPNAPSIVSWHWNFGDPSSGIHNTSTLKNPSHIYAIAGNYSVTLTVINSNLCEKDTVMLVPVSTVPVAMFSFTPSCVKTATQFNDLSTAPGSTIISWFWDFGDGVGTSNIQNPSYTYATAGTYNVKLRVTNLNHCKDSITIPVVSYPLPVAAFTYNSFFCPAGQVVFQDESHGIGSTITDRLWIFLPGSISSQNNPTFIFPVTDTNYMVTLIVTDDHGCKDTTTQSVHVKPAFTFTFTYDTACYGNPTHFHAINKTPGDSLYSLRWDFGDPNSGSNNYSTQRNPVHIFTAPSSYVVKLKAWDSDNCVDSVLKTTIIHVLPNALYSIVSQPCKLQTIFTDQSTPGSGTILSWTWNFSDGTPEQTILAPGPGSTTHNYAIPGSYRVTLKVTNSFGCEDTISKLLEQPSCVIADFNTTRATDCSNAPITFTDNSTPVNLIKQWSWTFGDGLDTIYTHHSATIRHTYVNPGSYIVVLKITTIVSGQSFTDTASNTVVVIQSPETRFTVDPVCLNQISLFKDQTNSYGADITSREWNFGDPASGNNNTSSLPDPLHKYTKAGNYKVSLVVMNNLGCKDSISKVTNVFTLPDAKFISTLACGDKPTNFYDRSIFIDTAIARWNWNFGVLQSKKDTSQIQDPVYEYKKPGEYTVRLVVKDFNGCYDTMDSTITVHPSPVSAFIVDNTSNVNGRIQLNNKSEGADSYYWEFGNGLTSDEMDPIVSYKEDGTYIISLVASNKYGCSDTTYYRYDLLFKGLYVPNAFVPESNIDGVNVFKPIGVNLKVYKVVVVDRAGNLLWQSTLLDELGRPVEGWNGKDNNGNIYPQGTYAWRISAVFIDGTIWQGSDIGKGSYSTAGTVSLIR
jgi:PKD repeat protein